MTTQRALQQRRTLRRAMRARRCALTTKERANTARAVARLIEGAGWLKPGQRIALYLAMFLWGHPALIGVPLVAR